MQHLRHIVSCAQHREGGNKEAALCAELMQGQTFTKLLPPAECGSEPSWGPDVLCDVLAGTLVQPLGSQAFTNLGHEGHMAVYWMSEVLCKKRK